MLPDAGALPAGRPLRPGVFPPQGARKGRVALLHGCAQPVLAPVDQRGRDPRCSPAAASRSCWRRARAAAARWCITWAARSRRSRRRAPTSMRGRARSKTAGSMQSSSRRRAAARPSRTTASCCAAIRPMPKRPRASRRWRGTSPNIWRRSTLRAPARRAGLTVAYQSACSLQHGQKITRQPKDLLAKCRLHGAASIARGASVLRLGRHLQHHAARDRRALRDRKVANIERDRRRRDRDRQYRLHDADRAGDRASRSCTRSSCSTGRMADRCRRRSSMCVSCANDSRRIAIAT